MLYGTCLRRRITKTALFAFSLLLFFIALPTKGADAKEVFVDEIIASVNNYAITRSEVIQETRYILAEQKQGWFGRLPAQLLNKVLERIINKQLIYQELERIESSQNNLKEDPALDRETLLDNFKKNFAEEKQYKAFVKTSGFTETSLVALMVKNKRIENFMKKRLDLLSRVSNEELKREVDRRLKNSGKDKKNRKEFLKFVKTELEREKYNMALENWLNGLKNRNRILQFVEFKTDEQAVSPLTKPDAE